MPQRYNKYKTKAILLFSTLILMTLNNTITANPLLTGQVHHECRCTNPRCITQTEHYLPHSFRKYGDIMICEYCDERILLK